VKAEIMLPVYTNYAGNEAVFGLDINSDGYMG
jgi:hypothetical protein